MAVIIQIIKLYFLIKILNISYSLFQFLNFLHFYTFKVVFTFLCSIYKISSSLYQYKSSNIICSRSCLLSTSAPEQTLRDFIQRILSLEVADNTPHLRPQFIKDQTNPELYSAAVVDISI